MVYSGRDTARQLLGTAPTIVMRGVELPVPGVFFSEASKIAAGQAQIPQDQVVAAIAASKWAQGWASGMADFVLSRLGSNVPRQQRNVLVQQLAQTVAERVAQPARSPRQTGQAGQTQGT